MEQKQITFTLPQVPNIVETQLVPHLNTLTIFTFKGPLGAGKTTMIKAFLAQCGVTDIITSPTFAYVKQYKAPDGRLFHHFDLYRLTSLDSFLELGFDEYLHQENAISVIEWPEVIQELLEQDLLQSRVCSITLDYIEDDLEKRVMKKLCMF